MKRRWSRTPRYIAVCVALGLLVASCGDEDDPSSAATEATGSQTTADTAATATTEAPGAPTTTAGATVDADDTCADREALRSSVDALQDVDLVAEGTNGLNAAISDVKTALTMLRESAGSELQPQVEAVQTAIDEVETAAQNLDTGGAAEALTAVANLATSAQTLLDSLQDGACGS